MEIINAIILGIIQGLTEFLPVSSSGHLEIAKAILGEGRVGKESMLMTVILHFATAVSTIVIFRNDLLKIFNNLFKTKNKGSLRFIINITVSMMPAALIGVLFSSEIEALFVGDLKLVGGMLILTGLLLFLADKAKPSKKNVGIKDALLIGIAQTIAIIPGISRSGATISTSVILGVDKEKSARFSFLMVVPLILGKMTKDIFSSEITASDANFTYLFVGFLSAFFTGILACKWMINVVKKSQLKYFSYYCFIVGFIVISTSLF